MFDKSGISQALESIEKSLKYSLLKKYGIEKGETTKKILKIHGLEKENFDFIKNFEDLVENNLNDLSIDDNSNKGDKTVASIEREVANPINKVIGYRYLYRQIKLLYGKNEAKRLIGELLDYSLAIHDSSKLLSCYCYAFDFSKIVLSGRNFGQLKSTPPKRLSSYIAALDETVHQLSNIIAGAIGISTLFLDSAHILLFKEGISLNKLKKDKNVRKYIENEYQQFVHSVNHLSRSSSESPFSNVSILDSKKLEKVVEEYSWYYTENSFFTKNNLFSFKYSKKSKVNKIKYIIKYILELQKIYIGFIDKGNPLANGASYRFPVQTINLSKKDNKIEDEKFLKYVSTLDIKKYNIFMSESNKFASCCFGGSQLVIIKVDNKEYIDTFLNLYKKYEKQRMDIFNGEKYVPGNLVRVQKRNSSIYEIILKEMDGDNKITCTGKHIFYTKDGNEIEAKDLNAGDKIQFANKHKKTVEIVKSLKVTDCYDDKFVYCFEIDREYESKFMLANGIVTHNCRLISNNELLSLGSQVNSFGAGSSVSIGSHRVLTVNMNRIALECNDYNGFYEKLDQRLKDSAKILKAHKELLIHTQEKGLQQFIKMGWIVFNRLFSTWGLLGYYEMCETFKSKGYMNQVEDPLKEILEFIEKRSLQYSKEYDIIINVECVPGESKAIHLAKVDNMLYDTNYSLYANQFVPLWKEEELIERLNRDGELNKHITGGGIVHLLGSEKMTSRQKSLMINKACESGCEHFAFNPIWSVCEDEHFTLGKADFCEECGKPIKDFYTRVVGFFTKVGNWNKTRREEEFPNRIEYKF